MEDGSGATPPIASRTDGRLLVGQPSLMSGCQKTPGGAPDCIAVGPVSS